MSSSQETSVPGSACGQEGRGQSSILGFVRHPPAVSHLEDRCGLPGAQGLHFQPAWGQDATESKVVALWGRGGPEERPAELASCLDFLPHSRLGDEASLENPNASELSDIPGDPEAGPSRRAAQVPRSASPVTHPGESEQAETWMTQEEGPTSMTDNDDAQGPSSDPESSGEFSEVPTVRVSICLKDSGSQAKDSSPTEPGDPPPKHWNVPARESFVQMPSSVLTSTPRDLTPTSSTERQAPSREVESSPSKKKQGVTLGKGVNKPSHPGAATVAGGTPKASPKKKVTPKKKTLWETSTVPLGRTFHQWGQRLKSAPAKPAPFPSVSGVGLSGRTKNCSLLPSDPKQSKNFQPGKRSVVKKTKEFQPVAKEDSDPARDASLQAQLPTRRAEPLGSCPREGEFTSADLSPRAPPDLGNSQASALSRRSMIRVSAPSGDQEPPVPFDAETGPPPGVEGCPGCQVLQKEKDDLKIQLAAMKSLTKKLQIR